MVPVTATYLVFGIIGIPIFIILASLMTLNAHFLNILRGTRWILDGILALAFAVCVQHELLAATPRWLWRLDSTC